MEDFPLLLLFFIFYLIVGSSKKKKKKQSSVKRQSPMRSRAQGEQMDMRALVRDKLTKKGFEAAFEPQEAEPQRCEQQRIHLHEVSAAQLSEAAEGEDPCHHGGEEAQQAAEADRAYAETDSEREALRQDVLRGVIMSEILTRPCDRMAVRRGGLRRHGY